MEGTAFQGAPARAWAGWDLLDVESGMNPLTASYLGAPSSIRGTDPTAYAKSAADWWKSLNAPAAPAASATSSLNPLSGVTDWLNSNVKKFAITGTGIFVGLILLAFALFLLWRD